jgi:hypothetical protein
VILLRLLGLDIARGHLSFDSFPVFPPNFGVLNDVFREPKMGPDPSLRFGLGPELAKVVYGAIRPCDLGAPKVALLDRR